MLKILTLPNEKLRIVSKKVDKIDKKIGNLVSDLLKILNKSENPKGIGIASPQVGIPLRVILVRFGLKVIPFINPEPELDGELIEGFEGCLSVPKIYGYVKRPAIVHIKAISNHIFDEKGMPSLTNNFKPIIASFDGMPARVIQHEVDHLNGKLFIDRVIEQKGKFYKINGKDKDGKEILDEIELNF